MTEIYRLYLELLKKYGQPKPWPWKDGTEPSTPLEICLGAILTQNTNWQNVEKALVNLRQAEMVDAEKLAKMPVAELEKLIKPSGFYRQKAERLKNFCRHLCQNYQGKLEKLWEKDLMELRQELLSLKGIGPETTDTILLYAGKKPIFVIDEYTQRFVKRHGLGGDFSYEVLQKLFMNNLPRTTTLRSKFPHASTVKSWVRGLPESVKIYEDYHALIVKDGKTDGKLFSRRPKTKRKISKGIS